MADQGEVPLIGGAQTSGIVRIGDTVHRPSHHRSSYVQSVLGLLERVGFTGAPRPLGFDDQGREVVTYIDGDVPNEGPFNLTDGQRHSAIALVRSFHDATDGSALAGDQEVVCHRDLGPHNTVFRGDLAVAIIDWDADTGPGRRSADFADAAWGFADLTDESVPVPEQARRTRLMCTAYPGMTPTIVVNELTAYFQRARSLHLAAGRHGAVTAFDRLLAWIDRHGAAIRSG